MEGVGRRDDRSRITRRGWLVGAGALLTSGAFGAAACAVGTSQGGAADASLVNVKPGTTIRLHVRAGNEVDTLEERLPLFKQAQGVEVAIESFPQNEYDEKIRVLLAGGSIGDVLWGIMARGQGWLWAHTGAVRFVDDLVKADKFDLSPYYPVAVDSVRFEGKLFGLPYKLQPGPAGIYYNVDAFTRAGLTPPQMDTSYEQLTELASRVASPGAMWGFYAVGANPGYPWAVNMVRAWEGDLISDDGKKSQLATPAALGALQWYLNLMYRHQAAPPAAQAPAPDFEKGQTAMLQSGSAQKSIPLRVRDAFAVGIAPMPKGPGGRRGTMATADFKAVTGQTKSAAAAWALTKFLCDKETGIRLGEGGATGASGTCGARKDVFHSERLLANPLHKAWIQAVEESLPLKVPWNFLGEEHNRALNEGLAPLMRNEVALSQATLAEVDRTVQAVLDKPRSSP
ncbi:MAG: extracellular solute-binding protein [Chloroflexota bacterium]|nr:extracellular solute-binding protein [Chloroflexota bacterium]